MTGQQDAVPTSVSVLVRDEVEVRALVPTRTPLEALFFMLRDPRGQWTGDAAGATTLTQL